MHTRGAALPCVASAVHVASPSFVRMQRTLGDSARAAEYCMHDVRFRCAQCVERKTVEPPGARRCTHLWTECRARHIQNTTRSGHNFLPNVMKLPLIHQNVLTILHHLTISCTPISFKLSDSIVCNTFKLYNLTSGAAGPLICGAIAAAFAHSRERRLSTW
jgi:hypothetical protein